MSRPTKYSEAILKEAREYLANYDSTPYNDKMPSVAGLAVALKISRPTIYDWAEDKDKEEFSYIVRELMATQEKVLFNGGLSGDFNASIAKLALTKHGYSDKIDQKQEVKITMSDEELDAELDRLSED